MTTNYTALSSETWCILLWHISHSQTQQTDLKQAYLVFRGVPDQFRLTFCVHNDLCHHFKETGLTPSQYCLCTWYNLTVCVQNKGNCKYRIQRRSLRSFSKVPFGLVSHIKVSWNKKYMNKSHVRMLALLIGQICLGAGARKSLQGEVCNMDQQQNWPMFLFLVITWTKYQTKPWHQNAETDLESTSGKPHIYRIVEVTSRIHKNNAWPRIINA